VTDPLILYIETATDICSVAVAEGDRVLAQLDSGPERSHATLLSKFIRQALEQSERELKQLDAVAVSKGPGSYTGLRIGVSTAKGISYALEIPLLSCGTLENLAHSARSRPEVSRLTGERENVLLCPMIDARRMEVYSAFFHQDMSVFRDVAADVIDENSYRQILQDHTVCFFGNGSDKCRDALHAENAVFIDRVDPSAAAMVQPVLERYKMKAFEDVAYFEPFYLKDFVATTPRKKVL